MDSFAATVFSITGIPVLLSWACLIFFPHLSLTAKVFKTPLVPLFFAALYSSIIVPVLIFNPESLSQIAQPTLPGIQQLLSTPVGATAGWIHFLSFDLFIGRMCWQKAKESGFSFWWVSPVLVLVLMLAPLGWLIFEGVSFALNRKKLSTSAA